MATLSLVELTKHFGAKVVAVDHVNLEVADGAFICLLGPSGCGKTTALRMIAGFETPTSGDIRIDGSSILELGANRRPTAMVFQRYTLWPHMTVADNISFGLRLRRMTPAAIQQKTSDGLELVGLAGYEQRYPSQLSGGQQQRVALARALVLEPKILLLDEPFSSLDALLRIRLREELRRIQRHLAITAIFVTHDQQEALSLADRIALMEAGRIVQLDDPSTLYACPRTLFAADFIGSMNLLAVRAEDDRLYAGPACLPRPADVAPGNMLTLAIRPEDFQVEAEGEPATTAFPWRGLVDQAMDMGHYRKLLVNLDGGGDVVTVYAPKALALHEGAPITLAPRRFLVYQGERPPVEMNLDAAGRREEVHRVRTL